MVPFSGNLWLYLSEFFNRHRSTYITKLNRIRQKDEFEEWLLFFTDALSTQAENASNLIDLLTSYRKELLFNETRIGMILLVNMLFKNPFVRIRDVSDETGLSIPSATKNVEELVRKGILEEVTGRRRNKLYVARRIMELLES